MRRRTLGAVLLGLLTAAGCAGSGSGSHDGAARTAASSSPSPPAPSAGPRLGGAPATPQSPPATPMDELEKPIAAQLAKQVQGQGLTLDYLRCPSWDGRTPERLTCKGYFDGVTAPVEVTLTTASSGAVEFDASLRRRIISVPTLVRRLRADGYTKVDCGDRRAYPSTVGSQLVCSVRRHGHHELVRATVTGPGGSVRITRY